MPEEGRHKKQMYTTLYYDEIPGSEEAAGRYRDWYISFSNRYGEEEVWRITNHVYKINNNKYVSSAEKGIRRNRH